MRWLTTKLAFDDDALHRVGSNVNFQLFSDKITPYMEGDIP